MPTMMGFNSAFKGLNTLIYKATCFSSTQPSSGLYRRTDSCQKFVQLGSKE